MNKQMASRPRVRSVALQRLAGHKSLDRSSNSSRSKEKGGVKSIGKRETVQAPGRKSLPRIEQGRSGEDQKEFGTHKG